MQVWLAPGRQVPAPSQRPANVTLPPLQVCALHVLPAAYSRHAPLPLQVPSVPQLEALLSVHWFIGSMPPGIGVQAPRVAVSAHDIHVPVHAVAQQTPCWQNPDAHSAFAVQATPARRLPQVVPLHTLTPLQLAFVVHDIRHWPFVPHT
jgi:hypothetical protein